MAEYEWGGGEIRTEDGFKAFKFKGTGAEYFKLWIVNILLTLVTLGIYYPWAKVKIKRYCYSNSLLDGRSFNYHASGTQIMISYLIGVSLIFFYIIIQQMYVEMTFIVPFILFCAIPWIIYRSIRFNLTVTSFSNVHFNFIGSLNGAYFNFFLYPLLFLLSIYLFPVLSAVFMPALAGNPDLVWITYLLPFLMIFSFFAAFYMYGILKKKNLSYIINNTKYGQGIFKTSLKNKSFMFIGFKTIIVMFFSLFCGLVVIGGIVYSTIGLDSLIGLEASLQDPLLLQIKLMELLPILIPTYLVMLLAFLFAISYASIRQRTYIYENTTLDDKINFSSTLRLFPFVWVSFSNFIVIILSLGLAYPWASVRKIRLILENTQVDTTIGMNAYLSQKLKEESSLEDTLGDSFDLNVGIGI